MIALITIAPPQPHRRFALAASSRLNLNWSFNNEKLRKLSTASFGLPALRGRDGFVTCPGAGACARFCYARQGWYLLPRVAEPRELNLEAARGDLGTFARLVKEDLVRMPSRRTVRVHDGGDFFSQAYLDAWLEVARSLPGKTFYAYTKSLHLDFSRVPSNFSIVQSEGGRFDHLRSSDLPSARVFEDEEALHASDYEDGHLTDELAIAGAPRIGLAYHGNPAHVRMTDELAGRLA